MRHLRFILLLSLAGLAAPAVSVEPGAGLGLRLEPEAPRWASPSPDLEPADVVRLQLEALQHNDDPDPDAGIARAYRFASPGNRSETGPLPRFSELIREGYPELLDHREARLLPVVQHGDEAVQAVELTSRDGVVYRYLFILSRQSEPPYQDCWMTDSVLGDPQGPQPAPEMTI